MATALLIIDLQVDFCEGGPLAVQGGTAVVAAANELRASNAWDLVVLTQDWHPADHASFAANHPGKAPFESVHLEGIGPQTLWPTHCVQGSPGARLHPALVQAPGDVLVRKGTKRVVDSYSAFGDALGRVHEATGLERVLRDRGVRHVVLCGLATDYCLGATAKDAAREGFHVVVYLPASAGISPQGVERELAAMAALGVEFARDAGELAASLRK